MHLRIQNYVLELSSYIMVHHCASTVTDILSNSSHFISSSSLYFFFVCKNIELPLDAKTFYSGELFLPVSLLGEEERRKSPKLRFLVFFAKHNYNQMFINILLDDIDIFSFHDIFLTLN